MFLCPFIPSPSQTTSLSQIPRFRDEVRLMLELLDERLLSSWASDSA